MAQDVFACYKRSCDKQMANLKDSLKETFDITDLGIPTRIVGIEITKTADSLTISQPLYIESILWKHKMEDANPVSTPLDPNHKLVPNSEQQEPNRSNAYAVNRLAAYTANPSLEHYGAAKRLLRYIKGTK